MRGPGSALQVQGESRWTPFQPSNFKDPVSSSVKPGLFCEMTLTSFEFQNYTIFNVLFWQNEIIITSSYLTG